MAVSSVMDAVGEVGAMSDFAWETFQSKKFHIFFFFHANPNDKRLNWEFIHAK